MDETVYTLVDYIGGVWRAHAEDGHRALLVPDPGIPEPFKPVSSNHAVLAELEGTAEIDGERWLAYRWSGEPLLASRLDTAPMERIAGLRLMLRILDGVAHARLTGCETGPLFAERILIGPDGSPLWAGILPTGTPGRDVVRDSGELMFRILTATIPAPDEEGHYPLASSVVTDLDPRLDSIVEKALSGRNAGYAHVLDLRADLSDYLDDLELLEAPEEDTGPVSSLMRRMGKTEDFPALSRAVGALNRIADADTEKLQSLASIILRDFSLTNKVLRLANSASYGQFGGATSTISRAVMVLGFNAVKALAMTVVLIEHLTNQEHAQSLKDEVARAFFASLISRKLAERCGYHDLEEARIAGMFHLLGKLLVLFYLRDDAAVIAGVVALGDPEEAIVRSRIGASYEELGMGVARAWHLPDKLVASMAAEEHKPRPPRVDADWLRLFANAGVGLMQATLADTEPVRYKLFLTMRDRFAEPLRLSERDLRVAVDEAIREALREATIFALQSQEGSVLAQLRKLVGLSSPSSTPKKAEPAGAAYTAPKVSTAPMAAPVPATTPMPADHLSQHAPTVAENRPEVLEALASCVQDVAETLVGDFKLNDLLRMILETLYRSLGADHVLLATRSVQRNAIIGRFGFGEDIDEFVNRFAIPLDDSADLFRVSVATNADVMVSEMDTPGLRERLPAWYRKLGAGHSFLMLPIVIDRKTIGLLYADSKADAGLRLGDRELALIKTMRNQAILAIRQKSPNV